MSVASRPEPVTAGDADLDRLLPLALSRPAEALAAAEAVLARRPAPRGASIARQARAIVLRDRGAIGEAVGELRRALRLAQACAEPERVADVQATLGLTLGLAGRTAEGLTFLDRAVGRGTGAGAGRILMRRASLLRILGRYDEALDDLRRSIALLRRGGDRLWEARSRTQRFLIYAAQGRTGPAEREWRASEHLFAAVGQELESGMAIQNRADVAYKAGDLAAALGFLDQAAACYAGLDAYIPELAFDRCAVLLAAGLTAEAVTVAEAAVRTHEERGGDASKAAELLFMAARAAQAAGRPALAGGWPTPPRALSRPKAPQGWLARAEFVLVQSRAALGGRQRRLGVRAGRLADRLAGLNASEAPAAHLLAGQLAADLGWSAEAERHLARAARYRHRGPAFGHAAGWLAHAIRAQQRGAARAMLIACRRGLTAASTHQSALVAPELRAHAAVYGAELAALAQRLAVRRGDARMLLLWSERWRASALAVPRVRPPDDPELAAALAALREVVRQLESAIESDAPTHHLMIRRRALEEEIRARTRRISGTRSPAGPAEAPDLATLFDGLAGHRLVEITSVDGQLYATTVVDHRVRTYPVGPAAAAVREVELARFMLRRLAHGRPAREALGTLAAAGAALQRTLLGPAAADLGGGPVVVIPPATLHSAPWGLVPLLRSVPTSVAPSAATWLRAGRAAPPGHRGVVLVAGPGLPGAGAEVKQIAEVYPGSVVLSDGHATAEATLRALDGAGTAHIAAHGAFRGENPLFSAVSLDDGPLTMYDLGRLHRAPLRLVVSSCESGVSAPIGVDELLGLVSALVPLGTASIMASVVSVNDAATAPLMVAFHERHHGGRSFSEALCEVRRDVAAGADAATVAAALSFVVLGR
jgi:tetratricopeptide (TPR) repeat protein